MFEGSYRSSSTSSKRTMGLIRLKFLLILSHHWEQKILVIRHGRDVRKCHVLYGVQKTYQIEIIQTKSVKMVKAIWWLSKALVAQEPITTYSFSMYKSIKSSVARKYPHVRCHIRYF